jgi:hypothetical protein
VGFLWPPVRGKQYGATSLAGHPGRSVLGVIPPVRHGRPMGALVGTVHSWGSSSLSFPISGREAPSASLVGASYSMRATSRAAQARRTSAIALHREARTSWGGKGCTGRRTGGGAGGFTGFRGVSAMAFRARAIAARASSEVMRSPLTLRGFGAVVAVHAFGTTSTTDDAPGVHALRHRAIP